MQAGVSHPSQLGVSRAPPALPLDSVFWQDYGIIIIPLIKEVGRRFIEIQVKQNCGRVRGWRKVIRAQ